MVTASKPSPPHAPLPSHYRRVLRHLRRMDRRALLDQVAECTLPTWVRQVMDEAWTGELSVLGLFHLVRRGGEDIEPAVLIRVVRFDVSRARPARRGIMQCYWPRGGELRVSVLEGDDVPWSRYAGSRVGLPGVVNGDHHAAESPAPRPAR
jgi:hypothetical protein